ncbi:MAG TPA: type II secretion system protein [Armatimonadaceae bacterium]|nr:type II secretion system protein [Armatimonadaceae bacterium]
MPDARKRGRAAAAAAAVTLIELLVVLALMGVVLSAAGSMFLQTFESEAAHRDQNAAQASARTAADTLTDDLRGAIKNSLVVPGTLTAATPIYFNVYQDDGVTVRRVRYWLNGTDLRREVVTYVDETATPGAATSATGGVVVARNIDPGAFLFQWTPGTRTAAVLVTSTVGAAPRRSSVTVRADVVIRNYLK